MSVKLVSLSYPELALSIYADRQILRREGSLTRAQRGLYFAQEGDRPRSLRDDMLFLCDDTVVVLRRPVGQDLALFEPQDYVEEIAKNRSMRPAKNLYKPLAKLSPDDFKTFVTYSCILRRWYREVLVKRDQVFTLFEALMKSKRDFLEAYFRLRAHHAPAELFSSILTFLARIEVYEDQKDSLSKFYKKVVRKGKGQNMNLARSAQKLVTSSPHIPLDSRVIQFCFDLRG